jgi:hypothetical protein
MLIPLFIIASCCTTQSPPCCNMPTAVQDAPLENLEPPTATTDYVVRDMRGWTVRINPDVAADDPKLLEATLQELDHQLYAITRVIPARALKHLMAIEIWVELDIHKTACMCYHVSRDWLIPNGYNADKEGTVEIGNARAFLEWTKAQPWMVLHELAHGYHDQVHGYEDESIIEGWTRMKDAGTYEQVGHISGTPRRHYALTNQMEWFAETTEAYFGTNDFHPYVRSELMWVDPQGLALMKTIWDGPPSDTKAPKTQAPSSPAEPTLKE